MLIYACTYVHNYSKCIHVYIDSCNHIRMYIRTYVPPEMKATFDELTKRATEKEAEMVRTYVKQYTVLRMYACIY